MQDLKDPNATVSQSGQNQTASAFPRCWWSLRGPRTDDTWVQWLPPSSPSSFPSTLMDIKCSFLTWIQRLLLPDHHRREFKIHEEGQVQHSLLLTGCLLDSWLSSLKFYSSHQFVPVHHPWNASLPDFPGVRTSYDSYDRPHPVISSRRMAIFVTDGSTGYNSSPGAATQAAPQLTRCWPVPSTKIC